MGNFHYQVLFLAENSCSKLQTPIESLYSYSNFVWLKSSFNLFTAAVLDDVLSILKDQFFNPYFYLLSDWLDFYPLAVLCVPFPRRAMRRYQTIFYPEKFGNYLMTKCTPPNLLIFLMVLLNYCQNDARALREEEKEGKKKILFRFQKISIFFVMSKLSKKLWNSASIWVDWTHLKTVSYCLLWKLIFGERRKPIFNFLDMLLIKRVEL